MKVLLLNMPVRFNGWQNLEMPLGIAYIASELERQGHLVGIKDYEVEFFSREKFEREIKSFQPDVLGVSFRSSSYISAKQICSLVKQLDLRIWVVLGGHHASAFPEDTLKDIPADFVIRGEGEYAMAELIEALSLKKDFSRIAGLTYRENGKIKENIARENIVDLDRLNFPAWHLLPAERYVTGSILTSRGCPFSCIYCDKGVSTRQVKFRSVENIYDEIRAFEQRYKKGRIYFVDDYFFLNKKRLLKLFNLIISNDSLRFKWYCQARVDGIGKGVLEYAKKSGCEMIIYGVETGDRKELEYINKGTTLEDAERALRLSKEAGIKTRANFMVGFPVSTRRMIGNSIRFAKKIDADLYRFFIVSALPNTVLWERLEKLHPELARLGWERFDFYSPVFDTIEIKKEDLVKYVMFAYLYVLKNKAIKELTVGLLPRLLQLFGLILRNRKIRGCLSVAFPACVNLLLEEWFLIRNIRAGQRLYYIKQVMAVAREIENDKGRQDAGALYNISGHT